MRPKGRKSIRKGSSPMIIPLLLVEMLGAAHRPRTWSRSSAKETSQIRQRMKGKAGLIRISASGIS